MATIRLTQGFRNLKVGERQTLLIKRATYDEKYMKLSLTFADSEGRTLTEKFNFMQKGKKDAINEVAVGIFSTIAKCATHDFDDRDFDPEEVQGLYIIADVWEQKSVNEDTGEERTYTHLKNYEATPDDFEGFEGELAGDDLDDDMENYL